MKVKFYRMPLMAILGMLLLLCGSVSAQHKISGKITSTADGQPVIGATVKVKNSSIGTVAGPDGTFSLNAKPNDVLVISFVGFRTKEIPVAGKSNLNIQLEESASTLNEVVVTGYGTQAKKDITSAVTTVSTKDLLAVPSSNLAQQLQGRAAGVTVGSENTPGGGVSVRIRGFGTLGNNEPLYIIDGVPTRDNLNNINQNDIESIQILKDATSAAIYGSQAGNGVVIITTKKGKAGAPKVTFDAYYGTQTPGKLLDLLNTQEYGEYLWQSKKNAGVVDPVTGNPSQSQYGNGPTPVIPDYIVPDGAKAGDPRVDPKNYSIDRFNDPQFGKTKFQITPANKTGTKWLNEIFHPAPIQSYQLGVTGGSDKGSYYFSVGHYNQDGILLYNGFKRYSIRANTQFTIKDRVRLGENLQVLYAKRQGQYGNQSEGNEVSMAYRMQPIVPVYDIAGNFAGTLGGNLGNAKNPVAALYRARYNGYEDMRTFGNVFGEVDILKGLTARTSFGLDATIGRGKYAGSPEPEASEPARTYSFSANFNYRYSWTWTNTLSYKTTFAKYHNVNAYIGVEAIRYYGENQGGFRDRYYSGDLLLRYLNAGDPQTQSNYGGAFSNSSLFSYFGQVNYAYKDKYLLQATLRRDASSRFLSASRYATFPGISAGWRVTQEDFMKQFSFINDFKLRVGYGQSGNQEIGDYNAYTLYQRDVYADGYSLNGNPNGYSVGFDISQFGNPKARWETTTSTNAGFDMTAWNDRIEVNFDVYKRKTDGLLYQKAYPGTAGSASVPAENVGTMQNTGVDITLNYRDKAFNNQLRYNLGVNFSTYRNKVLYLNPQNPDEFLTGFGLRTPAVTRSKAGLPISYFYGYIVDGIFQNEQEAAKWPSFPGYNDATVYIDGKPQKGVGKFKYRDVNGDGKITDADQTIIGSPHPKFTYGLNLNLGYKNFDLTLFAQGVYGNDLFNYVRYWTDFNTFQGNRSTRVLYDSWRPNRPNAKLPILDENDAISSRPSSYFIEKGSYLRFKNIQLSYTLPTRVASRLGMSSCRVYLQGQNLITITKYTGLDPEVNLRYYGRGADRQIGVDEGIYPAPKNFLVGLSVGF